MALLLQNVMAGLLYDVLTWTRFALRHMSDRKILPRANGSTVELRRIITALFLAAAPGLRFVLANSARYRNQETPL